MTENIENEVLTKINEIEDMTPTELFSFLKHTAGETEDLELKRYYSVSSKLLEKALKVGQKRQISRLSFIIKSLENEATIREMGVKQFIYREDLRNYIKKVENRVVKIADVEDFPREIPDEVVDTILRFRDKFSNLVIVYTDYTDELGKQVEKEKIDKDPILFGVFFDEASQSMNERMYFLADWEDEYCDLTLEKMVEEYRGITDEEIVFYSENREAETILNEAENYLENLKRKHTMPKAEPKKNWFKKIFTVGSGK